MPCHLTHFKDAASWRSMWAIRNIAGFGHRFDTRKSLFPKPLVCIDSFDCSRATQLA
jgi:hypothetical protein